MAIVSEISSAHASASFDAERSDLAASVERISASAVRWGIYSAVAIVPTLIVSPDVMFGYADVPKVAATRVIAGFVASAAIINIAASMWRSGTVTARLAGSRWLVASVFVFLLANILSTVFSITPSGSLHGAYPGFDGTDLYSLLSYAVIGLAAAAYLRKRRHFMSLFAAIAVAGSLASVYGIFQFAGLDPLDFARFEVNSERVPLTFGNPGFAGSFLAISLFATAGIFLSGIRSSARLNFVIWSMFAVQAFALGAVASRGAWVGVAVGAAAFAALALTSKQRRRAWPKLAWLVAPFAITAIALAAIPSGGGSDQPSERLQSINSGLVSGGLNGRLTTWRASIDLIIERPWLDDGSGGLLRSVFGYGPDTFRYAYQQVAPDEHVARFMPHAHNSVLNTGVELGAFGLIAWLAMSGMVTLFAVRIAIAKDNVSWARVTGATLVAAYIAHSVDQLAAVPRASDTLIMWAIAGGVIALWSYTRRTSSESAGESASAAISNPKLAPIGPALALPLVVAIAAITLAWNVGHVRADIEAASLQNAMFRGASVTDLAANAGESSRNAPDVAYYDTLEAMALDSALAVVSPASPLRGQIASDALEARQDAANGILPGEQFSLARALYTASASQPGLLDDSVAAYERLVALTPNYWAAWLEMAAAYGRAGQIEEGRAALQTAADALRRQPAVTREDPATLQNFEAVHRILGLAPGTLYP